MLRKSDIVARYGGEEFAIILKNTSKNDAFDVAEKIRKQIEASSVGEQNIKFTVSIGITDYIAYDNKHSIIKRSDEALYNAKTTGRNKCVII
jgi:diguanylate cyclase (GGDEF)-like protein